ncbi:VTT domain-containing protein [Lysinibacillus contaminans]|uniref:VTT domain-containing protein n=1 Tax=Lysinibacillus contaminans TaxID=1293441 RepID=UPI000AEB3349|nr:VTT domain-containing protein [Lysinibacillus contaminans]
MILGGVYFGSIEGSLLSTVGIVLSETLVYIFSRSFAGNKMKTFLENRHPELNDLFKTYNYKFLALGIICPIALADVICFLSASIGKIFNLHVNNNHCKYPTNYYLEPSV